ncbi:hypothetical protein [Demetria terragena]|uniref:hypothetical protein n=1 Tax=Demetria terragena TaxID=63959 RepID=UPI0003754195|nr:hypothetical protein [Demetria terragena]
MTASELRLADNSTTADLATYLGRARTIEDDGAVRLQARGSTLAVWVGVLKGRGLTGEGTVLGLRVLALAEPAEVDEVVPLSAVTDRLARMGTTSSVLPVPPMTRQTTWAAISPPQSGWSPLGGVPVEQIRDAAHAGIAEVASGAPEGSGAAAVESLRHRVWNRSLHASGGADGLPAGVAFGAYALGFLTGDVAQVFGAGRWFRVTTDAGHVLVR